MSDQNAPRPERRTAGRVDTDGCLPSQLTLDLETDVIQISVGGMMVETPIPLEIESKHQFTVGINKEDMELCGIVRNCQPYPPSGQPEVYRIGVEFCDLDEHQKNSLAGFVDKKLDRT